MASARAGSRYSGGAIAAGWAAELAPSYATDINRRLVGAAMGGVLVDPDHNLRYVNGSKLWAGIIPMAVIGLARAYHVDPTRYLSGYGKRLDRQLQHASILRVLGAYPGLTWAQLAGPRYKNPQSVPAYVRIVNQLIMGRRGTLAVPLFIGQGANGPLEGTPGNLPGIGAGDGLMVAGDVRALAREYCARGVPVDYVQYDHLSHLTTVLPWLTRAAAWLWARFAGLPPPQDCAHVAPGNSLAPIRSEPSS